jgi:hypothetical protein
MEDITTLTDEELLKLLQEWRLEPFTTPLPHNADIEPASLDEYRTLAREAERRGLTRR